jgi:hypothetical protein
MRSLARSPLALALLLLACMAQQLGAAAHGAMGTRAVLSGGMFDEICSSAGLTRAPSQGPAEPAKLPAAAGGVCDLCATATMASLPPASPASCPAAPFDIAPLAFAAPLPLASPPQRANRSRAPPRSLLA